METVISGKMSVKEFRNTYFQEEEPAHLYELMEGEILKRGSPQMVHQRIAGKLFFELQAFVGKNKSGEMFLAPLDVELDDYNCFQPDLFFIGSQQGGMIKKTHIQGAPQLVIEILSPSSVIRDRIQKKRIYEKAGVQEYWLISPEYAEIEIFTQENGRYELFSAATISEGELKSKVLDGLTLHLKEIFE